MKSFYSRENVTVYPGDCVEVLPQLPAASAQAIVTSPPYNVGKAYEQGNSTADYVRLLHGFIDGCAHVLDCGGWMIVNIADVLCGTDRRENINPVLPLFDDYAISKGFTLYDQRIWHKDPSWMNCQWAGSTPKSVDEFEYIYVYQKLGTPSYLLKFTNFMRQIRDEQKLSNAQIDSIFGFNGMAGHWTTTASQAATPTPEQWETLKDKLGIVSNPEIENIIRYSNQKLRSRLSEKEWTDWGSRGVWQIRSVKANNDHPAKFPLELPSRLIRLFTWEGDTVIDPFMGSGTTAKAAEIHGRKFIGIEKEQKYCKVALKNLQQASLLAFQQPLAVDTATPSLSGGA